jgi:hypothetical protein
LNAHDASSFFAKTMEGYIDYPFADESTPKFVQVSKKDPIKVIQTFAVILKDERSKMGGKINALKREKFELEMKIKELEKNIEKMNLEKEQEVITL